ncbi:MAG: GTP 3',8-cyclase MoaA [Bdellovibrionota bacterium]|nr:GTP 3',8-cyclase MoaA [Bdellovibrionota bacterium]
MGIPFPYKKLKLVDGHGREIHKLRISLLDACNMSCLYCMPEEKDFLAKKNWASAEEIVEIASNLVLYGIDQIRLTGGEPLLRPDLRTIIKKLDKLPLTKFGLTTNAIHLERELSFLKNTNCQYLNISLDSLDRENFFKITQTDTFSKVFHSLMKAQEFGLKVKVNTVLLKGLNDHEIDQFILFSKKTGIEVRFLELMKIGVANHYFTKHFISADEIIKKMELKWDFKQRPMPKDSTSFNFTFNNGAEIGFIASESKPFCGGCSRLRLGPDGAIRPCLFMDQGISLKGLKGDDLLEALQTTIRLKPTNRIPTIERPMHQIGG